MRIGIGTSSFFQCVFDGRDERVMLDVVDYALAKGVPLLDTAPIYGLGLAERLLKPVLARRPAGLGLVTKCGFKHDSARGYVFDNSAQSVREDVLGSLTRMGVDRLDYCLIHHPEFDQAALADGWSMLSQLVREGLIGAIGLANCTVADLERLAPIHPPRMVQVSYSILEPDAALELFPYCQAKGIVVTTYSPRYGGLLSGGYTRERIAALRPDDCRRATKEYQEPLLTRNQHVVACLTEIGQRLGCSPATIALAWVLANPAIDHVLVGASANDQVDAALAARTVHLLDSDMRAIAAASNFGI